MIVRFISTVSRGLWYLAYFTLCSGLKLTKVNPDFLSWSGCISYHEARDIINLKPKNIEELSKSPISAELSLDLNLSKTKVKLTHEGLCTSSSSSSNDSEDTLLATWEELEMIADKKQGCYSIYNDGSKPWHVSTISKSSGIPASLCPPLQSSGAPTMVLGGFTMHRIAGDDMNPTIDTAAKLSCFRFFPGASVLDTCMGLGYTALGAARKVGPTGRVVTIEYDEASIEMAAHNPWSQGLFDGTLPVEILQGDSCELIRDFPSNSFNFICHDPPARALTRTDVYGLQFYAELRRVLTKDGMLFHYIGSPDSKESGRLYKGIMNRMQEAGFVNIKKATKAYGLVASHGSDNGSIDIMKRSIVPKRGLLRRSTRRTINGSSDADDDEGIEEEEEVDDRNISNQ